MENVLFKISFPAEFHAQTAVECAIELHSQVADRLDDIERIEMETQEPGVRIIDKKGPLHNFADRDHCLQYMAAIGLIFGKLTADHYQDATAADARIDAIRDKMVVKENKSFTVDYYDLDKRAIGNSIQVFFKDGSKTDRVEVQYPIGHRNRRDEGIPVLQAKFESAISKLYKSDQSDSIASAFADKSRLDEMPATEFMELLVRETANLDTMLA